MATPTSALTVAVAARPEQVVDVLAELDQHVGTHPFLESATPTDRGHGGDGPVEVWAVVVHPPGLRMRSTATVVRRTPTSLRTRVSAPPTHGRVDTVTAPWPPVGYAARNTRAHGRTPAAPPAVLGDGG